MHVQRAHGPAREMLTGMLREIDAIRTAWGPGLAAWVPPLAPVERIANINALRRRCPRPWPRSPRHNFPDSDAGHPRVAPVYDLFTDGADMADEQDARAVLAGLDG